MNTSNDKIAPACRLILMVAAITHLLVTGISMRKEPAASNIQNNNRSSLAYFLDNTPPKKIAGGKTSQCKAKYGCPDI